MGLNIWQRISDYITYCMALIATGIGVMTISEKIAMGGLFLGAASGVSAWIHRRRIERAQRRRNELIAQILTQTQHRRLSEEEEQTVTLLQQEGQDDDR